MRIYGIAGLALLAVSAYGLVYRIEPFYSWFYCFAWWSYILVADNALLKLSGRSLLYSRTGELARMLPLSVFIWLVFEAYNFRLGNWAYSGVPSAAWLRWPGYVLAFATVLPGIFITSDIIGRLLFRTGASAPSQCEAAGAQRARTPKWFIAAGILLSTAPLFWPRYFFPAVWIGPIFLADPLLGRLGASNLSARNAAGDRTRVWCLMLGGLVCGFIWEFWNFWAGSKWLYTVPFFAGWKFFEMPLPGFLGFPPFAIECWIMYHLLRTILARTGTAQQIAIWAGIACFGAAVMLGIDAYTVRRFAGN